MKGNIREFVMDSFDYLDELENASINNSINRYFLEYIANGFVKYGGVNGLIKNIDKWIRSLVNIYPEIGFDDNTKQLSAVIDLIDQVVIIDEYLYEQLSYIINVQKKYGLLVKFDTNTGSNTTTIARFFESINRMFPQIKERYKGLGSTDSDVLAEIVMNPKTRHIYQVNTSDINRAIDQMNALVGKRKEDVERRKEMLLNFKFTKNDIDT